MKYDKMQVYFFFLLLFAVLVLAFIIFEPYLGAILLAATFAVIFYPLYAKILKFIGKYIKWKKGQVAKIISSLITVIFLIIIILAPLSFLGAQLVEEVRDVYSTLATKTDLIFLSESSAYLEENFGIIVPDFSANLGSYIKQGAGFIAQNIGGFFSGIGKIFVTLFLSLLAFYYFLKDGDHFKKFFVHMSPLSDKEDKRILDKLRLAINSVIRGSLVVAIVQGILTGLSFWIFGIPNPTLWGSFAAIAALLPTLGTSLVLIPGILFLLFTGNSLAALGLLIWGVIAVGLVDNFLGPQLMKQGVSIHPFVILLAVLGGIAFFGPVGFLFGPLIISLLFALFDIYKEIFLPEIYKNKSNS